MEINKTSKGKKTNNKGTNAKLVNPNFNKKHQIVRFNNYTDEAYDDSDHEFNNESDNESNNDSDYESDNKSNYESDQNNSDSIIANYNDLNIQKDPTDIYDSDEGEINEEANDVDNFVDDELNGEEYKNLIKYIYNIFLNKHTHLDNFRNRAIILKLCTMSVNSMPEHISNPIFYLNFIESSINHLKNMTTEEIEKISKENDEIN